MSIRRETEYHMVSGCGEPSRFHWFTKVWRNNARQRAGNTGMCIMLYDGMMSIYTRVPQKYTPCWSVHFSYPCNCTYTPPASHCQTVWWWWWWWWWWWGTDFPTTLEIILVYRMIEVQIANYNVHIVESDRTEDDQTILQTFVERCILQSASGTKRVCRW